MTQAGHEKATRKVLAHLSCPCRARPVQVATIAFTHTKTGHDKGHEGRFRWHEAATTSYVGATTAIFCRAPMFLYRATSSACWGRPPKQTVPGLGDCRSPLGTLLCILVTPEAPTAAGLYISDKTNSKFHFPSRQSATWTELSPSTLTILKVFWP